MVHGPFQFYTNWYEVKGLIKLFTVNRKGHFDRGVRTAINPYG
jgi:hypothetical protein